MKHYEYALGRAEEILEILKTKSISPTVPATYTASDTSVFEDITFTRSLTMSSRPGYYVVSSSVTWNELSGKKDLLELFTIIPMEE